MKTVPTSLRIWFKIHFTADMIFAFPLLFAPVWTLGLFGMPVDETLTVRLVGAALIGIGGVSLVANKNGIESYQTLLSLKILWSIAALVAIFLYILEGGPWTAWIFFAVFLIFNIIWTYYKFTLRK